jgi:hypothetical protein
MVVELGLYGAARMYWTMFSGALRPRTHGFGVALMVLGVVSVLLGAVMCFAQHHLKRDHLTTAPTKEPAPSGVVIGLAEAAGAVALAAIALARERVPAAVRDALHPGRAAVDALRALHTGQVGDFVAWFTLGVAAFGDLTYFALH